MISLEKSFARKNYPNLRQEHKSYTEQLDELDEAIAKKSKDKAVILANLRRAVGLITESLKVSVSFTEHDIKFNVRLIFTRLIYLFKIKDEDKASGFTADRSRDLIASEKSGNLFKQLHEILTSTEEIDLEELEQQSSNVEKKRSTLNVR